MFYRKLLLLLLLVVLPTGCNFGKVSLGMNRERVIPLPTVNVLPTQWEPGQSEPGSDNE